MKKIEDIWEEAIKKEMSGVINTEKYHARVYSGVKIVRDIKSGEINIYDTHTSSDHYRKINAEERKIFLARGWEYGVLFISLQAYKKILQRLINKIKSHKEKGLSNQSYLLALESNKEFYEMRQSVSIVKLNKIKSDVRQITIDF